MSPMRRASGRYKFGAVEAIKEDYRDCAVCLFLNTSSRHSLRYEGCGKNPGHDVAVLDTCVGDRCNDGVFNTENVQCCHL